MSTPLVPATAAGPQRLAGWVRHAAYPLGLLFTLAYLGAELHGHFGPLGRAYPLYLAVVVLALLGLERALPLQRRWDMTARLFWRRDLPMLALNGAALALTSAALTALARGSAAGHAPATAMAAWPWWGQALLAVGASDLAWYGLHRWAHEGRDPVGRWLWRVHVMHHLPEQVYVFMHAAGHPLNAALVRGLLMAPGLLWGLSPEAVFAAQLITGFQGLVSHCNADLRAGWLNHLLMGTELHRLHHSADPTEARNYAATLSLWDGLFGSLVLRPGRQPAALGVAGRAAYPPDGAWGAWLAWPFRCRRAAPAEIHPGVIDDT